MTPRRDKRRQAVEDRKHPLGSEPTSNRETGHGY